jgi:hypothetical protein
VNGTKARYFHVSDEGPKIGVHSGHVPFCSLTASTGLSLHHMRQGSSIGNDQMRKICTHSLHDGGKMTASSLCRYESLETTRADRAKRSRASDIGRRAHRLVYAYVDSKLHYVYETSEVVLF